MRLWPWKKEPAQPKQEPKQEPALLEDLPPKFEDDVDAKQEARKAANPTVVETVKKIGVDDFKNVNQIPCFRQAILTGAGIGAVAGSVLLLSRRPVGKAFNWAVGGFLLGSVVTWEQCRFRMRQGKKNVDAARAHYRDPKQVTVQPSGPVSK